MITSTIDPATSAALWILVKASALLGLAAIIQAACSRRSSAATRHLIWTLAIFSILLLPLLSAVLPTWAPTWAPTRATVTRTTPSAAPAAVDTATATAAVLQAPLEAGDDVDGAAASGRAAIASTQTPLASDAGATTDAGSRARFPWSLAMAGLYAAGVLVMLLRLGGQRWSVRRLVRDASDVQGTEWTQLLRECAERIGVRRPVRLLRSRACSMPMAFGTRRPGILIPATADLWPEDRRRAVILHELAHIARHDCLTQALAFVACTAYWFHPGAWWAARQLRIERELACDDRVIASGAPARDYAGHLLDIAYTFGGDRAPALAVSMARPRQLEGRLLAVLDVTRNRRVPGPRGRIAAAALAAALLVPLAGARAIVVASDAEANANASAATKTSADSDRMPAQAQAQPPASAKSTSAPVPAPTQPATIGPHLKEINVPVINSARRLVEAAVAAVGLQQDAQPGTAQPGTAQPGTWEIRPTDKPGVVHLQLKEQNSSSGRNVPIERLEGLTGAQLTGAGGPVQFRVKRDAGTFTFEGVLRSGVGAGTFTFTADPAFPAELAKRGYARPTANEQYQMARDDVGYEFLDELNKQGYARPEVAELVRAGQHGVQVTYMREMSAVGYRLGTLAPLIKLRDHGVTPTYVREMADLGYKGLSADAIREARDHGITPDYVRGMKDAGYGSLALEQIRKARDHGVTPQFVRELGELGHRGLPLDEVIRVRDHGVSPAYVRDMRQLGHALSIDALVRARDHGVDPEYIRGMAAQGQGSVPIEALIRLRNHGVTPKYAGELKALGYDRLTVDELVTLRNHGLTPERIRDANARAGTRLPVDQLKSAARGR